MEKQKLYDVIEAKKESLAALSEKIWEYAELSMTEFRSTAAYVAVLKEEGFTVEENLCGIPTAFSGTYGEGRPIIGILGEYDALSGLSQEAGATEHKPLVEGGTGQGCGHNLLGVGSLGAAIAVKEALKAGLLHGTVIFYGCPGEEGCAGKTFMARDGVFRKLDAALCWHPGDCNQVTVGSNAASIQVEYSFEGAAAHAADDPWNGRSALDAAELMNVGVQFLREHMPPKGSVHYAFKDVGGVCPNVVQPTAKLIYMVRGENVRAAKKLLARVDNIAKGAALMTGTTVSLRRIDGTSSTLSNQTIEQVLQDNLLAAPLPTYTEEELQYAAKLKATFPNLEIPGILPKYSAKIRKQVAEITDNGHMVMNNFIMPYTPCEAFSSGSTDVGDVSWLTPTAQFTAATWASGSPGHSWQNVSIGGTTVGRKGMYFASKVLAGTAADLMEDSELLKEAREEFNLTAAEGYDCPIEKDTLPLPG